MSLSMGTDAIFESAATVKVGLIRSDLPAASGYAAETCRFKRLILHEKRKSHFSFFAL
jgi:hypothetical protein